MFIKSAANLGSRGSLTSEAGPTGADPDLCVRTDETMYPEDRVLVAYVPIPADFDEIKRHGWYRVPQRHAPKGIYAEYFAFYFGRQFGPDKWSIRYYARRKGHELVARKALLPEQPDHPHADELYYKVQLGPLLELERPIVSLRWRRITFLHTTWDRFQDAAEINDLFVQGGDYVDRIYAALKERGFQPERDYRVEEGKGVYRVPLAIPCRNGRIEVDASRMPTSEAEVDVLLKELESEAARMGGQSGPERPED